MIFIFNKSSDLPKDDTMFQVSLMVSYSTFNSNLETTMMLARWASRLLQPEDSLSMAGGFL